MVAPTQRRPRRRPLAPHPRRRRAVPAPARPRDGEARLRGDGGRFGRGRRARVGRRRPPAYAVVDLRLEDGNGLELVELLRARRPDARIVVLTGYGAIASAVAAVKIGATDYLAKPADANDMTSALLARGDGQARAAGEPDVGRPRPLGAYPADLRALRPQRLGDRAAAQHAPAHPAAHPGQAQPEVDCSTLRRHRCGAAAPGSPRLCRCGNGCGWFAGKLPRRGQMSGIPPITTYDRIIAR